MQLLAIGLNHETAPLELRERVAFGPENMGDALDDLARSHVATEATILSTCNRTEIYCGNDRVDTGRVISWLSDHAGFGAGELERNLYAHADDLAVKHAFRVASGLDSMVLGEPQILGQMKEAFQRASAAGATGKVFNRLFQHTFSVAKQVRTDTSIGSNPVSVAYAGVSLAGRVFSDLASLTVLLIGAGETIELVARHLREKGVRKMIVANRSPERARNLATAVGCEAISLAEMPARLPEADIIVSSTASTLPILGKGAMEGAIHSRRHRPVFILDLAVPRDVEPQVGDLRDVYLYTVDDLQNVIEQNRDLREKAAQEAESIIDIQVLRFMRWMRALQSEPLIRTFRGQVDSLRQAELDKAKAKLAKGVDPERVMEQLAHDLSNKFAHHPSQQLRQADIEGNPGFLSAARKLFGL